MKQKDLKDMTKNKLIDFDEAGNRIIYIKHHPTKPSIFALSIK
jgi:hypothetical protein